MAQKLYTLGHSAMELSSFLRILRPFDITLLMDVRSKPQSMRFPHFDHIELESALPGAGIRYILMGDELGGRPDDPKAYREDGIVDYGARRKATRFRQGSSESRKSLNKIPLR